jgi:enoyl-CoA hydratase/carnithine racemase
VNYRHLTVEQRAGRMEVTMNRPEVLNALNSEAHFELADAFDRFAADESLHVATLTGAGERAFCVGSDLKERAAVGHDQMPPTGFAGLTERFDLHKPLIALVNGDAIGGGMEVVLACDLALAVDQARFGLPEPKVGLAASGGLHRLARQVPLKVGLEVALTGQLIDAPTAQRFGLINRVVPRSRFEDATEQLLRELEACAPLALRATKQMIFSGLDHAGLAEAYQGHYPEYERMLLSEDAREGNQAFVEKRPPAWKGR